MALIKGDPSHIIIPVIAEEDADYGKTDTIKFNVTVKRLRYSECQSVFKAIQSRGDNHGEPSDDALVSDFVIGWDLKGPDGTALDFNPHTLSETMEKRGHRDALIEAVMIMILGKKVMERLRQKN